jgi:TonB family protein
MVRFVQWILVMCLLATPLQGFGEGANGGVGARKKRVNVSPEYPEVARRLMIRGIVQLRVKVSSEGSVRSVEVVGGNPVLVEAAVNAVKKWRYEATGKDSLEAVSVSFN